MEYRVFSCISLESRSQSVPNLAKSEKLNLILFRMGIFGAAHQWGTERPPLPKTCHIYPTMMKLGSYILPKKDRKNI